MSNLFFLRITFLINKQHMERVAGFNTITPSVHRMAFVAIFSPYAGKGGPE